MNQSLLRLLGLLIALTVMLMGVPFASAQVASVVSYNLGETRVIQNQFTAGSRFYNMPVIMQGVLAVPSGEGPFPVALILHGAYTFCSAVGEFDADAYPCLPESDLRQYEGFTTLAQALADGGYIAMVPDLSAEFTNGFAEPIFGNRALQIIEAHLNALSAGSGFGVDVSGKVDITQLVIVGHSRGGPLAIRFTTDESTAAHRVSALALLTPAFLAPEPVIPTFMPVALVIAECDGDVGTDQPQRYLADQLPALRPGLTVISFLPGGTHNAFSTQLPADPRDACPEHEKMEPELQREIAARFLPRFFDLALNIGVDTP
jgi:dienelactone hydrolase